MRIRAFRDSIFSVNGTEKAPNFCSDKAWRLRKREKELNDQICATLDNLGQYQRRETLEFHNIPDQSTYYKKEDTCEIVTNFCNHYLGIEV